MANYVSITSVAVAGLTGTTYDSPEVSTVSLSSEAVPGVVVSTALESTDFDTSIDIQAFVISGQDSSKAISIVQISELRPATIQETVLTLDDLDRIEANQSFVSLEREDLEKSIGISVDDVPVYTTENLYINPLALSKDDAQPVDENRLYTEFTVETFVDDVPPILVHSSPENGEITSQDYFTFSVLDLPADASSGLDISTLFIDIDGEPYIIRGLPNDRKCNAELKIFSSSPKLLGTVFYKNQLSYGEHAVRIQIEDFSGNKLDTYVYFTISDVRVDSSEVKLEEKKASDILWDIEWNRKCDHILVREKHFVEDDLQTVRLNRSLIANSEMRVYINGHKIEQQDPIRGFEVVLDPRSVEPYRKHMLIFRSSFHSKTDLIEITYSTSRDTCPKCHNQGELFDIVVENNFFKKTILEKKLVQELNKIILTVVGSNFRYSWYGTSIAALIGAKAGGSQIIKARIQREVFSAIDMLRDIKVQQKQLQEVPDNEMIERVVSVKVREAPDDPTMYYIDTVVETKSGRFIETTTVVPFVESMLISA